MKKYLFILITICFFGCASFSKKISFDNQKIIDKKTINKINGSYEIMSLKSVWKFKDLKPDYIENDTISRFPLYITLKTNQEYKNGSNENLENYKVRIDVKDKKTISFSLLDDNKEIDNIMVNYKLKKNGYIYLKNDNLKTKGIPGLFGNFELNRTRIGLNEENNLILNHSHYIYGAVIFLIGDTKKTSFGSEYKKTK